MSQTITTGNVSLAKILAGIAMEVRTFQPSESDVQPQGVLEASDTVIADVSGNNEVRALYALMHRYMEKATKNNLAFSIFGTLEGSEEEAVDAGFKAALYQSLFWNLVRRLTGEYGPVVAIRVGFVAVVPDLEQAKAQATAERAASAKLHGALRQGGQTGSVN